MIFLRPASSYLRSVYAATVTQVDPALQWQNMLLEGSSLVRLARTPGSLFNGSNDKNRNRAELDKAFWQNINSVKLGAAGSANFVVAKDDVGNWYVKAMGSDPKAMVDAAKNLALYNAGAAIDTNLLRMQELRSKIDTENSVERRAEMQAEIDGLGGSASGPAVAERTRTVALFRQHYDALSGQHQQGLADRLAGGGLLSELRYRWTKTLDKSDGSAAVLAMLDRQDVKDKHQAAVDALVTTLDKAPKSAAGTASR